MDPLLLAAVSGGAGAVLALIGGGVGAIYQSRSDHRRWIRERRFESMVAARAFVGRMQAHANHAQLLSEMLRDPKYASHHDEMEREREENRSQILRLGREAPAVTAPFDLLGPLGVQRAIRDLIECVNDPDPLRRSEAEERFAREARRALRIPRGFWHRVRIDATRADS